MGSEAFGRKIFRASAALPLPDPALAVRCLCERFADYGSVSVENGRALIETGFGLAVLEERGAVLSLTAQSADETGLAFVKLSMAEHLLALEACRGCPRLVWEGDGAAGSPLPYFREMRVVAARTLTPAMRRVTLAGENLARFAKGGLHVRLLFPADGGSPVWPVTGEDGRPKWPEWAARPLARIYTIRRIDVEAGEVDIDMVVHGGHGASAEGPGARFAARAQPGDVVGMTGPGGGAAGEAELLLLAGDETALPAIGRILEGLAPGVEATALIEVAGAADEQTLSTPAKLDLRWLHRGAAAPGTATLLEDAVRAHRFGRREGGGTFAWVGCEARSCRAIRQHLRAERGLARAQHLAVAYWRRGFAGDDARTAE